jgi:hypothetical protein
LRQQIVWSYADYIFFKSLTNFWFISAIALQQNGFWRFEALAAAQTCR